MGTAAPDASRTVAAAGKHVMRCDMAGDGSGEGAAAPPGGSGGAGASSDAVSFVPRAELDDGEVGGGVTDDSRVGEICGVICGVFVDVGVVAVDGGAVALRFLSRCSRSRSP